MIKKATFILLVSLLVLSCKDDDSARCQTCSQPQTLDFTLCEEGDGNASVNGENTGVPYGVYLDGLLQEGVTCGGS